MIYLDNCTQKTKPQTSRYRGFHRSASFWYKGTAEGNQEVFNYLKLLLGTRLGATKWKQVDWKPCKIYELILGAEADLGGGGSWRHILVIQVIIFHFRLFDSRLRSNGLWCPAVCPGSGLWSISLGATGLLLSLCGSQSPMVSHRVADPHHG